MKSTNTSIQKLEDLINGMGAVSTGGDGADLG